MERHRSRSRERDGDHRDARNRRDADYRDSRDYRSRRHGYDEDRSRDDRRRDGRDRRRDDDDERRRGHRRRSRSHSPLPRNGGGSGSGGPSVAFHAPPHSSTTNAADKTDKGPAAAPLSLEALLRKKQEEDAAAARPVFMTKEERAKAALARRAEQAAAHRAHTDAVRHSLAAAAGLGSILGNGGGTHSQNHRDGRDRDRDKGSSHGGGGGREDRERQRELELIKKQYLGGEKQKKKILKPADRMKFKFDWDASEDTSRDAPPLFAAPHEATLMFGRGFRAGFDRREQRRVGAEAEAEALRRSRVANGGGNENDAAATALARARAADRYDDRGAMRTDTHWSEKAREAMTERDWRIFREDFNISYKGSLSPAEFPVRSWDEANLPDPVRRGIDRAGYKKPSPIQMASIPLGLCQRDVIGVAETGSGKTAAFVIPMLVYILKQPPMAGNPDVEAEGPYSVVLAPTRELAQQIEEEARSLSRYAGFRVVSVVGGQSIEEQGVALRKGAEIVVATPGRLVDCIERRYAVLNQCNYVVLDEADRMIDMGFEPQVMGVLDAMPSTNLKPENEDEPLEAARVYRTTYMFSATMPPAVERLARKYLRRPIVVTIGSAGQATSNVTQRVVWCKENEKPKEMARALSNVADDARVIVFANTQKKCEQVARAVDDAGYAAVMLHGGKTQEQREEAIRAFREGRITVLVATDVAGRGIDVPNVALVLNYDMPLTIEAYTHRIGRTGRAGRRGDATTLLTAGDSDVFYDLKKFLEESKASVPRELANHEAARSKPGGMGQAHIKH